MISHMMDSDQCTSAGTFNRPSDLMDYEGEKNAPTFDAVRGRQNFIFSFDIFDNWGNGEVRGDGRGGNLHNFQAHIKLGSAVFLKVQREVTILNRINISKSSTEPLTFVADHRGVDWQDSFTLFRNRCLVQL